MKESDFDRLLYRYMTGDVTTDEKEKLDAWLEVVRTRHECHLKLTKRDEKRLYEKITNRISTVDEVLAFTPEQDKQRWLFPAWMKVAASILIVFIASYTIWHYRVQTANRDLAAATMAYDKKILEDGSIVWYPEGTQVVYRYDDDNKTRVVTFRGEALFEVAKDATRPFVIVCDDIRVQVTGTSFTLKQQQGNIELNVLTGSVMVSGPQEANRITVTPRQRVIYGSQGLITQSEIEREVVDKVLASTSYDMRFQNERAGELFRRLEKKFDIRIITEDASVLRCRVTADFTDQSLETTMLLLAEILDIDYRIEETVVKVKGIGC